MEEIHSRRTNRPQRNAIALVAFGSSLREARCAYDQIAETVGKAFPGTELRWAYTSRTIRNRLLKEGLVMASPEVALARLMEEGFTHVAILSLHVFPGKEFHDLYFNASLFEKMMDGFERVVVARPLLASYGDMERVAKALLDMAPGHLNSDEGVIFVGHGNEKHPADAMFAAMSCMLDDLSSGSFVASVQGRPNLQDILIKIHARKIKKVFLIPFMLVAGDHVKNDIAGDKPESWKSVLAQNGVACEIAFSGLADNPAIVEIWVDHLRSAFAQF